MHHTLTAMQIGCLVGVQRHVNTNRLFVDGLPEGPVGRRLYYCNALQYDAKHFNTIACKEYRTLSPDLCVVCTYCTSIPAITQISTLVISHRTCCVTCVYTNSPQWRTKVRAAILTFSSTRVSINPFALCVHQILSYSLFHPYGNRSSGFPHLHPNCLE